MNKFLLISALILTSCHTARNSSSVSQTHVAQTSQTAVQTISLQLKELNSLTEADSVVVDIAPTDTSPAAHIVAYAPRRHSQSASATQTDRIEARIDTLTLDTLAVARTSSSTKSTAPINFFPYISAIAILALIIALILKFAPSKK